MKRDTVNYVAVGGFVAVMALAFAILLIAVTGRSGPVDDYVVFYDNVAGLKFGTSVFYEGFRVGQIESITPVHGADGVRYRIAVSVSSGWKIPSDSIARIESSGLISAVAIQITEGQESDFLEPGATIDGRGKSDMFSVLNQAAADFRELSQDGVMPMLVNVNARVTELSEEMLRFRREDLSPFVRMMHERMDQDLFSEAVELLEHLDSSAQSLQSMLNGENQERVHSFLEHINSAALNLNELVERIEGTRVQMNGVLGSLGELVTDNQSSVGGAATAAEVAMQELEIALKTINQNLASIMYNIEGGSRHMGEFARTIRENPSRLIRKTTPPGANDP